MGVDLILAGIHAEVKSLFGEKLFLSQFTKMHKKKENNAFGFFFCIIQSSQSCCFYLNIYVFTEVCRIQKGKKALTKLIRSFGKVTDQTEDTREATIVYWLS